MRYCRLIYQKLMLKSYSTLAGAIAFFLIINGGSIIYLMVIISDFFQIDLNLSFGMARSLAINAENSLSGYNIFYAIFFFGTNLYCASSLFFHLLKAGEIIYGIQNEKFSLFKRFIAVILLVVVVFIIEMAFVLLLLSKYLFANVVWQIIRSLLFILIPYLIAVCIQLFITPREVRFKDIRRGTRITTIFWYVSSLLFLIYTRIFTNYKAIYGALSFFIVFMIWVYLIAQGLVIGIIYNFYYREKHTNSLRLSCVDLINKPLELDNIEEVNNC